MLTPENTGCSQVACNIVNATFLHLDGFAAMRRHMDSQSYKAEHFAAELARVTDRELKSSRRTMKVVEYDDGNASHPNHLVLVRADTDEKARRLADPLVADRKDSDEEWFDVKVSENTYNLVLPPLRDAEVL